MRTSDFKSSSATRKEELKPQSKNRRKKTNPQLRGTRLPLGRDGIEQDLEGCMGFSQIRIVGKALYIKRRKSVQIQTDMRCTGYWSLAFDMTGAHRECVREGGGEREGETERT